VVAGKHPSFTGVDKSLPAFRISANEITIGQYAEFLETLGILSKDKREHSFDSEDQPAEKTSHVPTDWSDLFAAAQVNGIWQNQSVTLDSPVVGVDWWDASAYAEWKKARLPTQEQWMAALISGLREPEMLPKGPWISVTSHVEDRTPTGILGMAGSVSEWTSRRGTNPANPLGEPLWVIVGGSYLKQGSNALTCEWTQDRSLRRSDLGFRIVFDGE
jgi:formylglycine-generating enzyme required for sulfatase activity